MNPILQRARAEACLHLPRRSGVGVPLQAQEGGRARALAAHLAQERGHQPLRHQLGADAPPRAVALLRYECQGFQTKTL